MNIPQNTPFEYNKESLLALLKSNDFENHQDLVNTFLVEASLVGDLHLINYLLTSSELFVRAKVNHQNYQALINACSNGHLAAIQLLFPWGSPWTTNVDQHQDLVAKILKEAIKLHHHSIVDYIDNKYIRFQNQINQITNVSNAMIYACMYGNMHALTHFEPLLKTYTSTTHQIIGFYEKAFSAACIFGHTDTVKYLLTESTMNNYFVKPSFLFFKKLANGFNHIKQYIDYKELISTGLKNTLMSGSILNIPPSSYVYPCIKEESFSYLINFEHPIYGKPSDDSLQPLFVHYLNTISHDNDIKKLMFLCEYGKLQPTEERLNILKKAINNPHDFKSHGLQNLLETNSLKNLFEQSIKILSMKQLNNNLHNNLLVPTVTNTKRAKI